MTENERYAVWVLWSCNGKTTANKMRSISKNTSGIVTFSDAQYALANRIEKIKPDGHLPRNWRTI